MIVVVVVLVLLGLGLVMMSSPKKSAENKGADNTNVAATAPTASVTTQNKSLKELMTLGIAQKCTIANKVNGGSNTISIYLDNGKIRGDIVSVTPEKTINSHMIVQGSTTYMWMEDQKTGFKMTFDPEKAAANPPPQNNGVNPDERLAYNCSPWSADASVFNLPTGVEFSDFSKMAVPPVGGTDKCAACNYLSGDPKVQCLKALNCD